MADSSSLTEYLNKLVTEVQPLFETWGYPLVFVAILVEGMGIPAPGLSLLLVGLVLADTHGDNIGMFEVSLLALSAATLGGLIGYAMGRQGVHRLLVRFGFDKHMVKMERVFDRYGQWVILLGRFPDVIRQIFPIFAGMMEMPFWRFFVLNLLGATVWVGFWSVLVYLITTQADRIKHLLAYLGPYGGWYLLAGALLAITVFVFYRRQSKKHNLSEADK